jgi:hypothetical protein
MVETQQTIAAWVAEAFGTTSTPLRMFARTAEEMSELLEKTTSGAATVDIVEEAADTAICLNILCDKLDCRAMVIGSLGTDDMPLTTIAALANYHLARAFLWYAQEGRAGVHTVAALQNAYTALAALCERLRADFRAEIDKKMTINRARKWTVDASGCGYHVPDGVPHG